MIKLETTDDFHSLTSIHASCTFSLFLYCVLSCYYVFPNKIQDIQFPLSMLNFNLAGATINLVTFNQSVRLWGSRQRNIKANKILNAPPNHHTHTETGGSLIMSLMDKRPCFTWFHQKDVPQHLDTPSAPSGLNRYIKENYT